MKLFIVEGHMPGNGTGLVYRHLTQARSQLNRRIRRNLSRLHNAIQPAGFTRVLQLGRHILNAKMVVKFEARRARLGDLNQSIAPAINIANKDVLLRQPFR